MKRTEVRSTPRLPYLFSRFVATSLGALSLSVILNVQLDARAANFTNTSEHSANETVQIAQSGWGSALSRLNSHVSANRDYYNNYALSSANEIASGEKVNWQAARMNIDADNGNILLSLAGRAVVTGYASLFVSPPAMELHVLFTPDECFHYSYADYRLGVSGNFGSFVRSEVDSLLRSNRAAMESSLNNEVYYTLNSLQSLGGLGCY